MKYIIINLIFISLSIAQKANDFDYTFPSYDHVINSFDKINLDSNNIYYMEKTMRNQTIFNLHNKPVFNLITNGKRDYSFIPAIADTSEYKLCEEIKNLDNTSSKIRSAAFVGFAGLGAFAVFTVLKTMNLNSSSGQNLDQNYLIMSGFSVVLIVSGIISTSQASNARKKVNYLINLHNRNINQLSKKSTPK